MDLLEYQGKQLFARHNIPVPAGRPATTSIAAACTTRIGANATAHTIAAPLRVPIGSLPLPSRTS